MWSSGYSDSDDIIELTDTSLNLNVPIEAAVFLVFPSFLYVMLSYALQSFTLTWVGSNPMFPSFFVDISGDPSSISPSHHVPSRLLCRLISRYRSLLAPNAHRAARGIPLWLTVQVLRSYQDQNPQSQNTRFAPDARDGVSRVVMLSEAHNLEIWELCYVLWFFFLFFYNKH